MTEFLKVKRYKSKAEEKRETTALGQLGVIPKHPFRLGVIAPSGGGKSTIVNDLLTNPHKLYNYFHNIYIISPSFYDDRTYDRFRSRYNPISNSGMEKKRLITKYHHISEIDEEQIEEWTKESFSKLFVFDDIISDKNIKSNIMKTLLMRGRHFNASVIICSQSYTGIPRSLRLNFSNLMLLGANRSEVERVSEEWNNIHCDKDRLSAIIQHALSELYSFFHVNRQCKNSREHYRKGYGEIYEL